MVECCVSTSTSSALTLRSDANARARLSAVNVLPSPGRALVTMISRLARRSAVKSFLRPRANQVSLDEAKFLHCP